MQSFLKNKYLPALAISFFVASSPALADKPEWAGKDKHENKQDHDEAHGHESGHRYFGDQHRHAVNTYYADYQRQGKRCPPGLAKKNNGCIPPGQARKWHTGQPLPRDVVYYNVPQPLVVQLGVPPQGHKYVRVGADILLIAVGSRMVVDGITDLGRM